jgi:glycosyltransferase involved in cell wall biosynthesis
LANEGLVRCVLIDIMMPFYGRVDHFKEAVRSVIEQEDPEWRLTVLDDKYPDASAGQWLVELDDPRITYVRHETNLGINKNFQESLERSTAEWVVIFGCDDVMLPGYVSRVKELVNAHPDATFVQPGVEVIDGSGAVVTTLVDQTKKLYRPKTVGEFEMTGERLATSLIRGNWMYFPSLCWRRSAVAPVGFRENLRTVQDLALAIDIVQDGAVLVVDDRTVFQYRRHEASVSSSAASEGSRFAEEQEFFDRVAREFRERGWTTAARAAGVRLSSRLNAVTRILPAVRSRSWVSARRLLGYAVFGRISAASGGRE